ncbi:PREDICTED: uncharacterized protein LOC109337078 [Lupinus angustifolius]|uniref:uncharacterized protein LOC109337078 n=1 Tax=Lupinus angustifolius TaxID=3871 RepID=UPI00092F2572|nr:PREDICTED: uncharacterized protein LOC109337078 [Lupinus angustifolius]
MDLFDLPLAGLKFTWILSNGSAMSRLDRFLVNDSWLNSWGRLVQLCLNKTFSDHCPIMIKNDVPDWRPSLKVVEKVIFINSIDKKGCDVSLSDVDISARRSATADLWRLSSQKDNLLLQKFRQRWLYDGDSNSNFFHASINRRRRSNEFLGLLIDGEWSEDPVRVKDHIRSFFLERFAEHHWNKTFLDGIEFKRISEADSNFLIARFEEVEVKEVVLSYDVDDFFCSGNLARGCNASFIGLILKSSCLQGLGDYRPISLVGCIHKIFSKLMAGCLKKVLHSIISECQTAFLKGKYIMDGVFISNEIIDQAKNNNADCFMFKVNFEKAYDSIIGDSSSIYWKG